jgi:hypothetical protein
MRRRLQEWYVGDDLKAEIEKRQQALQPALEVAEANGNVGRFGQLLTMFHLDAAEARQVLLRSAGQGEENGGSRPVATGKVSDLRERLRRGVASVAAGGKPATVRGPMQERAAALTAAWIGKLRRFSAEPTLRGFFGFSAAEADALVVEMIATAVRSRLQERLVQALGRVKGGLRFDQAAERRAVAVSQIINEQVNFVGLSIGGVLAADRPKVESGPIAFEPPPPPGPRFEIGEQPEPSGALFCLSWVDSLAAAIEPNVRDRGDGSLVDQRQNDALGVVLGLL